MPKPGKSSYADAGVSIDRGNNLVERIKPSVKNTHRQGVMGSLGGFGALFDVAALNYRHPVLVSGTDGVGTKINLAIESGKYSEIGIDLVAMCVNDLVVQGADPLFFLDYYATSRLDVDVAEQVIQGIARGCEIAGCALVGGETAEMPGMYKEGDFDLAGFCVGIVEKDRIIDGSNISNGNKIIALSSSGPHSNGYSLIRKILSETNSGLTENFASGTLGEILLKPTRIYVKSVLELLKVINIRGIAHITGGGLLENIPRILPVGVQANIHCGSWQWPSIFEWLQEKGNIDTREMYRTFNCGVGMVLVVAVEDVETCLGILSSTGEDAWVAGEITSMADAEKDRIILV